MNSAGSATRMDSPLKSTSNENASRQREPLMIPAGGRGAMKCTIGRLFLS